MLTTRQERILWKLDKLGFASRSQIQRMFDLGSNRNAQRVLQNMNAYVNIMKRGEYVYYLNKKGRDFIGSDKKRSKGENIEHSLLRNEIYILYDQPNEWRIESPIKRAGETFIIPDVTFEANGQKILLEVDRLQTMVNNRKKIEKYAQIKEKIPFLVWIVENHRRQPKIMEYLKNNGITRYHVVSKKDLVC